MSGLISIRSSAAYVNDTLIPITWYPNSGYPQWDNEMGLLLNALRTRYYPKQEPRPDHVLYVGCGRRLPYKDCYCVDLDPNVGDGIEHFTHADAHALPFTDGQFAWVLSSHTLEHLHSCEAALLEQARVVEQGGLVGAIVPDVRWTGGLDATHVREYTKEEFEGLYASLPKLELIASGEASKEYSFFVVWRKA
jgi:SAM-dependent methyltransferase